MSFYQLKTEQRLPADVSTVWSFLSNPANLKKITPNHMGFDIITPGLPEHIYPGMIIEYRVSPMLKIPLRWVTEITEVHSHHYFVDEQRVGPYKMWHHEHFIEPIGDNEVLIRDIVSYQLPLGVLGSMAHSLFVRNQLKGIFAYRERVFSEHFRG